MSTRQSTLKRQEWSTGEGEEGRRPDFCKCTYDSDELGVSLRRRAASSIIHLGNKLINEVNEEEQLQ